MLPDRLISPDLTIVLLKFDRDIDNDRVASLFMKDELWLAGFDACGHGQPRTFLEARLLAHELYSKGELYSIYLDGDWVGTTGIISRRADGLGVMMGRTLIDPSLWGRRINSVVKQLLLSSVFDSGVETVRVTAVASNVNSLKALHKLGFVETRRKMQTNRYTGEGRDTIQLALTYEAWLNATLTAAA